MNYNFKKELYHVTKKVPCIISAIRVHILGHHVISDMAWT